MRSQIYNLIDQERNRQDAKWGEQNHEPGYWTLILTEEAGEVAKAVLQDNEAEYIKELVQVAASAVAALESYYRQQNLTNKQKEDIQTLINRMETAQRQEVGKVYTDEIGTTRCLFSIEAIFSLLSRFSFCKQSELRELMCFIDNTDINNASDIFVLVKSKSCAEKLKNALDKSVWGSCIDNMLSYDLDKILNNKTPDQCMAWFKSTRLEMELPSLITLSKHQKNSLVAY